MKPSQVVSLCAIGGLAMSFSCLWLGGDRVAWFTLGFSLLFMAAYWVFTSRKTRR